MDGDGEREAWGDGVVGEIGLGDGGLVMRGFGVWDGEVLGEGERRKKTYPFPHQIFWRPRRAVSLAE